MPFAEWASEYGRDAKVAPVSINKNRIRRHHWPVPGAIMNESPFESIEGAQEFVDLLIEAVNEASLEVKSDIDRTKKYEEIRHKQALMVVAHRLNVLTGHLTNSRRILNDLRSLRRLLLNERNSTTPVPKDIVNLQQRKAAAGGYTAPRR